MFGNFGGGVNSKKRKNAGPQQRRRFAFEPLEERTLLSVYLWTGGSALSNNWSDGDNWVGNGNGYVPQPGDELQFAGNVQTSTQNDFLAGTSFKSIDFAASGFVLAGNDLTLTDGIKVDPNMTGSAISLNVALANEVTVEVDAGSNLTISG
jgi:hypothetical protein